MSKDDSLEVIQEKYWIRIGIAVQHIDYPEIKMRVQNIRKVVKNVSDGKGGMIARTFTVGINVAWVNKDNKYEKGAFTTHELTPWPVENKTKKAPAKRK